MLFTMRSRLVGRVVLGALVPLAVAGACLVPAPALADAAAAAGGQEAREAASQDALVSLGGVSMSVPQDWSVVQLGTSMVVAASQDGALSASIAAAGAEDMSGAGMPAEASAQQAFFDAAAAGDASTLGGAVAASQTAAFADGTPGYLYVIDATGSDEPVIAAVAYIPLADGSLVKVTLGADPVAEGAAETLDAIIATIDVGRGSGEESADAPAELPVSVEAAGISFGVPEGMEDISEDGSEELDLVNADGTLYLSAIPDIFDAVGAGDELDDGAYDAMVELIAAGLGGETVGSTTIEADGAPVRLYALVVYTEEGQPLLGSLGFVEAADGTTTCLLGLCSAEDADDYGEILDAVYASIRIA